MHATRWRAVGLWCAATTAYVAATAYLANWSSVAQFMAHHPTLYAVGPFVLGIVMWRTPVRAALAGLGLRPAVAGAAGRSDPASGPHDRA